MNSKVPGKEKAHRLTDGIAFDRRKTVLSAVPRTVVEMAGAVGLNVPDLVSLAGIDPDALSDPDRRVPVYNYEALLRICEDEPRSREGLVLAAQSRDVGAFGVVSHIVSNAPTVAEGFKAYERHGRLLSEIGSFGVRTGGTGFSIHISSLPPLCDIHLFNEGTAVMNHSLVCALLQAPIRLRRVEFQHARHRHSSLVEELLDAPASYRAPATVLHYESEVGRAPISSADPMLFLFLERHAAAIGSRLRGSSTWSERTRELLLARLSQGKPVPRLLARELAVSARTLQRRLAEEGTTLARLLEDARRETALACVEDRTLSIAELGFMLGYSDLSAFHRAFKRWTGVSPARYRRLF